MTSLLQNKMNRISCLVERIMDASAHYYYFIRAVACLFQTMAPFHLAGHLTARFYYKSEPH